MKLKVAKWGDGLALRIPAEVVRQFGLREGATLEVRLAVDEGRLVQSGRWSRRAFAAELAEARGAMPISESMIDAVRAAARY